MTPPSIIYINNTRRKAMRIDVCIYLNKLLVQDLSALVGGGYIESLQCRIAHDSSETNKLSRDHKGTLYSEIKRSNNDKDKNIATTNSNQDINDYYGSLEGREFTRNEETRRKIYTSFFFLEQVLDELVSSNAINSYDACFYNDVTWGELLELKGRVEQNPLMSYLSSLISLIDCYGAKELDKFLETEKPDGSLNYTIISKICVRLMEDLLKNSTQELVVICEDFKLVLTCNLNFFEEKNANIYDFLGTDSRILFKVMKKIGEEEELDLLKKTGNGDYNRRVIESFKPYLEVLKKNGILVPEENNGLLKGRIVQGIPLGMYV